MNRRDAIKQSLLLTGFALSASSLATLVQSCNKAAKEPDWKPAFLTQEQADLLAEVSETILPRTDDSPGARDVNVHRFIDQMLKSYMPEADAERFRQGLDDFSAAYLKGNPGKVFAEVPAEDRLEYVNYVSGEAFKAAQQMKNPKPEEVPFFLSLRQAVVFAYFTSEEVGTKVLAYDPIPGPFQGCVSLEETTGGKAWALQ